MHDIKFNFILIKFIKLIYFDHISSGGGEETQFEITSWYFSSDKLTDWVNDEVGI